VQEAFLRTYEHGKNDRAPKAFLYSIARTWRRITTGTAASLEWSGWGSRPVGRITPAAVGGSEPPVR